MRLTAIAARGLEQALAGELAALGVEDAVVGRGTVSFEADLDTAYRACLWLRTASRVLLPLARFPTGDADALYEGVQQHVAWHEHLGANGRLWIDVGAAAALDVHTHYLAQKTKDAICDQLRARHGERPSVDRHRPDVRVHVHLGDRETTVSLDLAGGSLHKRGYRSSGGEAPLKESLAAGLLWLAGWPSRAARAEPLVDPMCGSGTLLVEAALWALDVAPGLLRPREPMTRWLGHDRGALARAWSEAEERARAGATRTTRVLGFDASEAAVRAARAAAARARVERVVDVRRGALADVAPPDDAPPGLVVTNPPYGIRLGEESELVPLYEQLGDTLRRRFPGYHACVLAGSALLAKHLGLRATRRHVVFNGPIECRLLEIPIAATPPRGEHAPAWRRPSAEAAAFENRLRKNLGTLGRWASRAGIECYRLYDADIPEYNVAIDRYGEHVVVQEYAAPRSVPAEQAARRLRDALLVTASVLGVPRESIVLKVRRRQVQGRQYENEGASSEAVPVHEGGLTFLVRLSGHIDTGLFAEQRLLRAEIAAAARGKRFLNLFAYTCTASVYAAHAGALATTSVDLSARYLAWGRDNFAANGLPLDRARFVEADCKAFLRDTRERFDVALLNPPSYSRSHRMRGDFDVQRDHVDLVRAVMDRLDGDGTLYFATHARGFALDPVLGESFAVEDLGARCVPRDHARHPFFVARLGRRAEVTRRPRRGR